MFCSGERFVWGFHYYRPHETFHEASRRFYPNELFRVPIYEIVPIDCIIGPCVVLDVQTYCRGRPKVSTAGADPRLVLLTAGADPGLVLLRGGADPR